MNVTSESRSALRSFARNGRWGICSGCPRTSDGDVFPEFCAETARADHQIDLLALVSFVQRNSEEHAKAWDRHIRARASSCFELAPHGEHGTCPGLGALTSP